MHVCTHPSRFAFVSSRESAVTFPAECCLLVDCFYKRIILSLSNNAVVQQIVEETAFSRSRSFHFGKFSVHVRQFGESGRSISVQSLPVHLRRLTAHIRSLPAHLGRLTAHARGLSVHLGRLTAHVRSLSAHLGRLTAHIRSLPAHLGRLTVHVRELRQISRGFSIRALPIHLGEIRGLVFFHVLKFLFIFFRDRYREPDLAIPAANTDSTVDVLKGTFKTCGVAADLNSYALDASSHDGCLLPSEIEIPGSLRA